MNSQSQNRACALEQEPNNSFEHRALRALDSQPAARFARALCVALAFMKAIRWVLGGLIVAAVAVGGLLSLMPSDVVTNRYPSLREARADRLFERGWLPDILPPSATDIRTSNNLDLNLSDGEFSFVSSDYNSFAARLQPQPTKPAPFSSITSQVAQKRADGFSVGAFEDDVSVWIFFCKANDGHCEYTMWLQRG
jgi:hypothetical protein